MRVQQVVFVRHAPRIQALKVFAESLAPGHEKIAVVSSLIVFLIAPNAWAQVGEPPYVLGTC